MIKIARGTCKKKEESSHEIITAVRLHQSLKIQNNSLL